MYPETCKFYTIVYSLVVLWCCAIRVNSDNDNDSNPLSISYSNLNSDLLNLLSGNLNETGARPLNAILSLNISAQAINFNIPLNLSDLFNDEDEHEKPNKTVRVDYTLKDGIGYYKLHKTERSWNDARKNCIAENAHLAVVNSEKEERALRQMMADNGDVKWIAIGIHNMFNINDWETVTGQPLEFAAGYKPWAYRQPDNVSEHNRCAFLYKDGGLYNGHCNRNHQYICEIPL